MTQHIDVVALVHFSIVHKMVYISEMRESTNRMLFPTQFESTKNILRIPNTTPYRCVSSKHNTINLCVAKETKRIRSVAYDRPPLSNPSKQENNNKMYYLLAFGPCNDKNRFNFNDISCGVSNGESNGKSETSSLRVSKKNMIIIMRHSNLSKKFEFR